MKTKKSTISRYHRIMTFTRKWLPALIALGMMTLPSMAHAADLDAALTKGSNILLKIAFLVGSIAVMAGGWSLRRGESDAAKMSILGGLVMALAFPIMGALYDAAGLTDGKVGNF